MMVFFWWRSPVEDTVVRTRLLQSTQEHARSRTLDDHKSGPFLSDAWVGRRLAGAQAGASVVSKSVYRPGYATRKAVMLMRHGVRVRVGGWGQAGSVICASSCVYLRSYSNGNGRHQPCPDSPPLPSAACSRAAAARRLGSARARLPRPDAKHRLAPVWPRSPTAPARARPDRRSAALSKDLHLDGLRCSLFVPFNGELRKTVRPAPRAGRPDTRRTTGTLGASATLIRWFTHPSASCAGDALRRSAITAASCAGE